MASDPGIADTLMESALRYADRGWAVFPLVPDGKIPLVPKSDGGRGCLDATADLGTVARWWRDNPRANIGIATGPVSALFVFDIDVHEPKGGGLDGPTALARLEALHGPLPATLSASTGGGGEHRYFRWPADRELRNRARIRLDGVPTALDCRAEGGYVAAPPSVHPSGAVYRWTGGDVAEAPGWLLDLLCPALPDRRGLSVAPIIGPTGGTVEEPRLLAYGRSALDGACGDIVVAGEGSRHDVIRNKALWIGRCIAGGLIGQAEGEAALQAAGEASGKSAAEVARCVAWGLERGLQEPYRPEEREVGPRVHRGPGAWIGPDAPPPDDSDAPAGQTGVVTGEGGATPPAFTLAERPTIRLGPDIADIVDEAEQALLRGRVPLYQRAGRLARIAECSAEVVRVERQAGPTIQAVPLSSLTEVLSLAASWMKFDARSKGWIPTKPPPWVAETLAARGVWALPPLRGLALAPTMRLDGTILDEPGYDPESGLVLLLDGRWPRTRGEPTIESAQLAAVALGEALENFPFAGPHHASGALAAILTAVGRHAIDGPVPLFVVSAKDAGTGKTLLWDLISTIGTGKSASRISPWETPEEARKLLLSVALAGDPVGLIDNWPAGEELGTPALDLTITSGSVRGRVLGASEMTTCPWDTVLGVTGNNVTYAGDTGRRTVAIELDAKTENPEERTGFAHDPLLPWVLSQRKRLVIAALTVLRAYHVAGRPRQALPRFGSFEAWSDLVRSAIVWLGHADPCAHRETIRAGDGRREDLRQLLRRWHGTWGGYPRTASQVRSDLQAGGGTEMIALREALEAILPARSRATLEPRSIGRALAKHKGSVRDGLYFDSGVPTDDILTWMVRRVPNGQ